MPAEQGIQSDLFHQVPGYFPQRFRHQPHAPVFPGKHKPDRPAGFRRQFRELLFRILFDAYRADHFPAIFQSKGFASFYEPRQNLPGFFPVPVRFPASHLANTVHACIRVKILKVILTPRTKHQPFCLKTDFADIDLRIHDIFRDSAASGASVFSFLSLLLRFPCSVYRYYHKTAWSASIHQVLCHPCAPSDKSGSKCSIAIPGQLWYGYARRFSDVFLHTDRQGLCPSGFAAHALQTT